MKTAFITTIYHDRELTHIERLKKEIRELHLDLYEFICIDSRKDNRGYAYGINEGIKKALKNGAEFFVVLNPDVSVPKKINLFDGAKHFDIWGGAMRQNNTVYYGGELDKWRMSSILSQKKPVNRFSEVAFVSGAFMVIKKKVIERIGLWDESYFLYYDEVDYCVRAAREGFRLGIDTNIVYDHFERSDAFNPKKSQYLAKSRLKFFLKYSSLKQKLYECIRIPKTVIEERTVLFQIASERKFLMNFVGLNASSLIAKVLNFILFLFLIRFLTPAAYGTYILVWTQVNILAPLLDFGTTSYGLVHVSKDQTKELSSVFSLRIVLSILVFIATILLAYFMGYRAESFTLILLLSIVIFSNMASGSLLILTSVKGKTYVASSISTAFSFISTISLVLLLIFFKSLIAVFIGLFILYSVYTVINMIWIYRTMGRLPFVFEPRKWWGIIKKSYVFVLIGFFAGLYFRLDVFLLEHFKSTAAVGIYSAGYKFFDALIFIAASYNIASTPLLANDFKTNRPVFFERIRRDIIFLGCIGLIVSIGTFLFAPLVLPFFLKGNYDASITVLRIVIFGLPLILFSSIFLNGLYVIDKARVVILIFLAQVFINFSLNWVFIPHYSYIASSYITVFSEFMNLLLTMAVFLYFVRKLPKRSL